MYGPKNRFEEAMAYSYNLLSMWRNWGDGK